MADSNQANVKAGKPYQFLYILDGSSITQKGPGACKVVQTIAIDPKKCMTPHLMGHNEANHDIYIACVGKPTAILRFIREREISESYTRCSWPAMMPIALLVSWRLCLLVLRAYADQIVDYVGAITALIVVVAVVVGFVWW